MHITHVISGLTSGGAETMLYRLLSVSSKGSFSSDVISFTDEGLIGPKIRKLGVPVTALGMRRGFIDPIALVRLFRLFRRSRPRLVQTWMYHADLLGGVVARIAGGIPVIWGVHHTNLDPKTDKKTTILVAKACAKFSHWIPDEIICCSEATRNIHVANGYKSEKMQVIQNGVDLKRFCPSNVAHKKIREELGLTAETPLIGLIGRFHPQKDHHTFIEAATRLHGLNPDVNFLLCGQNVDWDNSELVSWIDLFGIREKFHLLGQRNDMHSIQASLDVAGTASSHGEAFPLVIGEAMACGVPCVVTDVGDSAFIVGESGLVVTPRDPAALAKAWEKMLSLSRQERLQLGERARKRAMEIFDLRSMVSKYENLYKSVIQG